MPDLRIIQAKNEAAAYVSAQEQNNVNLQAALAITQKMSDTLDDMSEKLEKMDERFVRTSNIHVPSTWENIVKFFTNALRCLGIIR